MRFGTLQVHVSLTRDWLRFSWDCIVSGRRPGTHWPFCLIQSDVIALETYDEYSKLKRHVRAKQYFTVATTDWEESASVSSPLLVASTSREVAWKPLLIWAETGDRTIPLHKPIWAGQYHSINCIFVDFHYGIDYIETRTFDGSSCSFVEQCSSIHQPYETFCCPISSICKEDVFHGGRWEYWQNSAY